MCYKMFDYKDEMLDKLFGSGKTGKNNPMVYSGEYTFIDQRFFEPHENVIVALNLILKSKG